MNESKKSEKEAIQEEWWKGSDLFYSDNPNLASQAIKHLTFAAERGHVDAQYYLAQMYDDQNWGVWNPTEATKWYSLAAKKKNRGAQYHLAHKFLDGDGVKANAEEAANWLREAGKGESPWNGTANCELAQLYEEGHGVDQDLQLAIEYYEKAVKCVNANARVRLGELYYHGEEVEQDYSKALNYFRYAAQPDHRMYNHPVAQYYMGEMHYHGDGLKQDFKKAFDWYKRSADQGDEDALYSLGHMYLNGQGVVRDIEAAKECWAAAEEQGFGIEDSDKETLAAVETVVGIDSWIESNRDFLINLIATRVTQVNNEIFHIFNSIIFDDGEDGPFSTLRTLDPNYTEMTDRLENEYGDYDISEEAFRRRFLSFMVENWSLVVEKRLEYEKQFKNPSAFAALRRFMIVLKEAGIEFFTQPPDGLDDLIGPLVYSDDVHSDYETNGEILNQYSSSRIRKILDECDSAIYFVASTFEVIMYIVDGKFDFEFSASLHDNSCLSNLEGKGKLGDLITELDSLGEKLGLPIEIHTSKNTISILFDISWERKLPEIYYDTSNQHVPEHWL